MTTQINQLVTEKEIVDVIYEAGQIPIKTLIRHFWVRIATSSAVPPWPCSKPMQSSMHASQHADTSGVAGVEATSRPLRSKSICGVP